MLKGGDSILKQLSYKDILKEDVEREEERYGFLPIDGETFELHKQYVLALQSLYPQCGDPTCAGVANDEEVADFLKVSVEAIRKMRAEYDMCRIVSLDSAVRIGQRDDDVVAFVETIEDTRTADGAYSYLDSIIDCLTDEERFIVCAKNGVLGVEEQADGDIAERLNMSPDKIDGIYKTAILKIKEQRI